MKTDINKIINVFKKEIPSKLITDYFNSNEINISLPNHYNNLKKTQPNNN